MEESGASCDGKGAQMEKCTNEPIISEVFKANKIDWNGQDTWRDGQGGSIKNSVVEGASEEEEERKNREKVNGTITDYQIGGKK